MKSKVLSRSTITRVARRLRASRKKIVFTNGTFDVLHLGHVRYLQKAKNLGHVLVVGVNSDKSVRGYKGPGRPINPQKDRIEVLTALSCVDYAVVFSEPTPLRLIHAVRPHVLVKGADWEISQIAGAPEVLSWGGSVRRMPLVAGRSSSRIIKMLAGVKRKR
ncbi:MAG: D-glycero-beta-D-manno-heptose 1-phosphate adenylyltransferase [Candidatus Omnitrophota bacterium]|nr:D-glycero-beta-D-manno-heptose 1-phosphate adenylyltransferase [Candidatus Omnitrophota bacterium]